MASQNCYLRFWRFRESIETGPLEAFPSDKDFLKKPNAIRILDFTVPSGSPILKLISEWLIPEKYASASAILCGSGIAGNAAASFETASESSA